MRLETMQNAIRVYSINFPYCVCFVFHILTSMANCIYECVQKFDPGFKRLGDATGPIHHPLGTTAYTQMTSKISIAGIYFADSVIELIALQIMSLPYVSP